MTTKALKSRREERIVALLAGTNSFATQHAAWRAHLSRIIRFPFVATFRGGSGAKPFMPGAIVQVIGISNSDQGNVGVLAKVMDGQRSVLIPLELLTPREADEATAEAVSDWRVWCTRNAQ